MADLYDVYSLGGSGSGPYTVGSSFNTGVDVSDASSTASIAPGSADTVQDNGGDAGLTYDGTVTVGAVTGFVVNLGGTFALYVPAGSVLTSATTSTLDTAPTWTFANPCFVAGTMIATPDGERAVETLAAGDLVLTADGAAKPVRWLGQSTVARTFADPLRVLPIRIAAGALGENLPARDLLVSPGHAMLIDGVLVHASALVNGSSVVRESAMPTVFTYYHVELDSHEVLLAEGAATESYLDGVENMAFDNAAERPAALGQAEEMAYPRVKAARQLPRATRDRLAARAAAISPDVAAAA